MGFLVPVSYTHLNVYPEAIFNIFNNKGYTTSSYHDYAEYYYARRTIHPNICLLYTSSIMEKFYLEEPSQERKKDILDYLDVYKRQ